MEIDHEPTKGQDLMNVIQRLRGDVDSTVMLTISRSGLAVPFEVNITRKPINVQNESGKPMSFMSRESATHEVVVIMRKGSKIPAVIIESSEVKSNGLTTSPPR